MGSGVGEFRRSEGAVGEFMGNEGRESRRIDGKLLLGQ